MITSDMEDDALETIAAHDERSAEETARTWLAIRDDFRKRGPFTALILQFRHDATDALAGLAKCDPTDAPTIRSLQNDVQRFIATIEQIHAFKEGAAAFDAAFESSMTDADEQFIATLEGPAYDDR